MPVPVAGSEGGWIEGTESTGPCDGYYCSACRESKRNQCYQTDDRESATRGSNNRFPSDGHHQDQLCNRPNSPPQVDAKKVEAEKKRIQQNVLERQTERAKLGDARALYDIGLRYLKGDGVEADREKALEHLRQSAKGGESLARRKLILLGEIIPDPK